MCQKYQAEQKKLAKRDSIIGCVLVLMVIAFFGTAIAKGGEPKPWVRMTSPSGCTGVVINASRQGGIHILTCAHCVSQEGKPARFTLFKDGEEIPDRLQGVIVKVHPGYSKSSDLNDVAYCWVSPENYPEKLPLPSVVPLSRYLKSGMTVLAVGTNAGNTITPVLREVKITDVLHGGRRILLNEGAWGGHSGGPVMTVSSSPKLVGVLWGRGKHANGKKYSSVTGLQSLHEIVEEVRCSTKPSSQKCKDGKCQCPGGICINKPGISYQGGSQNLISQVGKGWTYGEEPRPQIVQAPPPPVINDSRLRDLESRLDRMQGKLDRSQSEVQILTLDLTRKTGEIELLTGKNERLEVQYTSSPDQAEAPSNSVEVVAMEKEKLEQQTEQMNQMRELLGQVTGLSDEQLRIKEADAETWLEQISQHWIGLALMLIAIIYGSHKVGEKRAESKAKPSSDPTK